MKQVFRNVGMLFSVVLLISCGKLTSQPPKASAGTSGNEEENFGMAVKQVNPASPGGAAPSTSAASDNGPDTRVGGDYNSRVQGIVGAISATLDIMYGSNPSVTKVVTGGAGFTGVYITPTGTLAGAARVATFEKDSAGKFQLLSGTPMYVSSINANLITLFIATGYLPIIAGAGSFCAGTPGNSLHSGAMGLGLAVNVRNGSLHAVAGSLVRNGSQYQACSLQGCTSVQNVPIPFAANFPVCNALLK